jgi:hypothetical protein
LRLSQLSYIVLSVGVKPFAAGPARCRICTNEPELGLETAIPERLLETLHRPGPAA